MEKAERRNKIYGHQISILVDVVTTPFWWQKASFSIEGYSKVAVYYDIQLLNIYR